MKPRIIIDLETWQATMPAGRLEIGDLARLLEQRAIINVQCGDMRFLLCANARRGPQSRYWHAWKWVHGKVRKRYLGRPGALTYQKLYDAAGIFAGLLAQGPQRAA